MKKDASSEEKLLNLIRKKNPADKKEDKSKAPKANPAAWVAQSSSLALSGFRKNFMRGLLLVCMGLTCYIASRVIFKSAENDILPAPAQEATDTPVSSDNSLLQAKPFSVYAQTLSERDIFASPFQKPLVDTPAAASSEPAPAPTPTFDLSQNYKLVGIILDNDPQAVIEDIRNQRTLFLSKGDQLEGGVLDEISDGRVVFLFNNQRIEMAP